MNRSVAFKPISSGMSNATQTTTKKQDAAHHGFFCSQAVGPCNLALLVHLLRWNDENLHNYSRIGAKPIVQVTRVKLRTNKKANCGHYGSSSTFFFLRLPFDHHGSVSKMFQATYITLNFTGPFNWGEAHFAGETVRQ